MNRLTFICIASIFPAANSWILPGIAAEGVTRCRNLQNNMLPETATSIFAGAAAGAVGVGVAFPLDTVKTKQQVEQETSSRIEYSISPSGDISIVAAPQLNSLSTTVNDIWKSKGLGGFYGGVQTSMLGQAVIKATAFSVNTAAMQANYDLETAAAIAGLVTAFIAVPVDRIKVLMQTDSFKTEHECLESVLDTEGVKGLLFTGLVPTLFREIPAYTLYFSLYGMLMSSAALGTATLGPMAPMVSGALAGALCVVPIHPVDVVKTIVQHSATDWKEVVSDIYEGQGLEGFWEGLIPRMGRAAINHSVTFAVYESLMYLR